MISIWQPYYCLCLQRVSPVGLTKTGGCFSLISSITTNYNGGRNDHLHVNTMVEVNNVSLKYILWALVLLLPCSLTTAATKTDTSKQRKKISNSRYTVGGIAAIIPGLGIGHAIQGRWMEGGWIFTASQLGAAAIIAYATTNCLDERGRDRNLGRCFEDGTKRAIGMTAYAIIFGFRIAEIVHVWKIDHDKYEIVAKPKEQTSTYSLLPYFHGDGITGVQLAVSLPIK